MSIFVTDKGQQGHHHSLTKGETVRLTTVCRKCKQHRGAVLVSIVLFATGGLSGILFQKYYPVGHLLQGLEGRSNAASTASVPMPRAEIPLSSVHAKRVMVALVFGQSNAANFGESPHTAREGVYNFYQGKLCDTGSCVEPRVKAHRCTLSRCLGRQVTPRDLTDDRLATTLDYLGVADRWVACERELNQSCCASTTRKAAWYASTPRRRRPT